MQIQHCAFKDQKFCQKDCYDHMFMIEPKFSDAHLKNTYRIDYCPIFNDLKQRYENIIPAFNNDRITCFPAFIMELDKAQCQSSLEKYQYEHQLKIDEHSIKKISLNFPKPGRKHRYCGVCKKNYDDYYQHIKSDDHISCFNAFKCTNLIKQLVIDYHSGVESPNQKLSYASLIFDSNTLQSKGIKPLIKSQKKQRSTEISQEYYLPQKRRRKSVKPQSKKQIKDLKWLNQQQELSFKIKKDQNLQTFKGFPQNLIPLNTGLTYQSIFNQTNLPCFNNTFSNFFMHQSFIQQAQSQLMYQQQCIFQQNLLHQSNLTGPQMKDNQYYYQQQQYPRGTDLLSNGIHKIISQQPQIQDDLIQKWSQYLIQIQDNQEYPHWNKLPDQLQLAQQFIQQNKYPSRV